MMADNITIQKLKNLFVFTMEGILEEVYDLPGMYTYLVLAAISLILHIHS